MGTIALLTDFGLQDHYVGTMKGVVVSIAPSVSIVDITHAIPPHAIFQAAFTLKSAYRYFPRNTVFVVVIDPGVGSMRKPVIIRTAHYFFIGPDNGVLSLAAYEDGITDMRHIQNTVFFLKPVSHTFHGRDVFAPAAAHITKGTPLRRFGEKINVLKRLAIPRLVKSNNVLKGKVIYTDRFGNLITNIKGDDFQKFTKNKKIALCIKGKKISVVGDSYQSVADGKPLMIKGSSGFMEVSVNKGSAKNYFKAVNNTPLIVAAR